MGGAWLVLEIFLIFEALKFGAWDFEAQKIGCLKFSCTKNWLLEIFVHKKSVLEILKHSILVLENQAPEPYLKKNENQSNYFQTLFTRVACVCIDSRIINWSRNDEVGLSVIIYHFERLVSIFINFAGAPSYFWRAFQTKIQ